VVTGQPALADAGDMMDAMSTFEATATSTDPTVRRVAAEDPACPPVLLWMLLGDSDRAVRRAASANPSTPSSALAHAAAVESTFALDTTRKTLVLDAVATNPSTPPRALEALARHPHGMVRVAVARNPSTPPAVLEALAGANDDPDVLAAVANHPACDPHVRIAAALQM